MDNKPSMIKAAAIGGLAAAVLGGIPLVGDCLTMLCCSPLIGGGLLAAFMYSREAGRIGSAFTVGTGALVGLFAAVFYALGSAVVGLIVRMALGVSVAEQFETAREQMEQQGNMPPEAMEFMDKASGFLTESGEAVIIIMGFGFALLLGAVFCTIGGLIGGAVFKKDAPVSDAPAPPQMGAE